MHRFDFLAPALRRGDSDRQNTDPRGIHVFRRITGYHNAIDGDNPPDYERSASKSSALRSYDALPPYSCSVAYEGVMQMKVERPDPFHKITNSLWEPVHIKLQGTLLQVSTAKTHGLFTHSTKRGTVTGEPGRPLRTYTLQHAECGLASDFKRYELLPKSPVAQLLPDAALKQLQESDPDQFVMVYNHVARLRLEEVQLVLRFGNGEERAEWMDRICAAIDISPPLEARSEPRNHTLPRRRRRDRRAAQQGQTGDAPATASADPSSSTQPGNGGPSGAEDSQQGTASDLERMNTVATLDGQAQDNDEAEGEGEGEGEDAANAQQAGSEDPDREDLDLAFMAAGQRSRNAGSSAGIDQSGELTGMFSPDDWGDAPSKTAPPPAVDPVREARYRRRCMPMLVHNSRYASNVIIHKGKRVVIDWDTQSLRAYPAKPPTYEQLLAEENPSLAATPTEAESPTGGGLKKLLRHASAAEVRSLARFRSKDVIREGSSSDGAEAGRSSEDQASTGNGPSKLLLWRDGGSLSKRIKTFARNAEDQSVETGSSQQEAQQREPLTSDAGLIPVTPTSPTSFAPEVVPQRTTRGKASKILGPDAPSVATAPDQPSIVRSPTVMSDPAGSAVSPIIQTPTQQTHTRFPKKAHKILGSISGWPHSPVSPVQRTLSLSSQGSINHALASSTPSPSATSRIPPQISELSPTPTIPQSTPAELPQTPTTPTISTAATSPTALTNTASRLRPTPLQPKPSPVELSALPPTPRAVSTPILTHHPDLPQKRLTAQTGLIPVAAGPATPTSTTSKRRSHSANATPELPAEAGPVAPAPSPRARLSDTPRELPASRASSVGPGAPRAGPRIKRMQSSDAIPTRPRHHDKAFRTLGIVG